MFTRRDFLSTSVGSGFALAAATPVVAGLIQAAEAKPEKLPAHKPYALPFDFGLGGVAIGNAFKPTSDKDACEALEMAWKSGVRYFDTSPFYGYGLSERRYGSVLDDKRRDEFILSTKVGRIFKSSKTPPPGLWVNPSHFDYKYDYTASGVRRSIEDSLQRLGIESIDIAFIHDLSPDNKDFKGKWKDYFEVARKGAMVELSKMRKEGLIKAWGLGVNEIDPILMAMDVADPDICLSATQYSLIKHEDALNRLFPACDKRGVKIVVGAPLNAGFLAGVDRYDYEGKFPEGALEKRKKIESIARKHGTDLRTAALQFSHAPKTVAAIIPGSRTAKQAEENSKSMTAKIPSAFWKELKSEKLIAENAPEPA